MSHDRLNAAIVDVQTSLPSLTQGDIASLPTQRLINMPTSATLGDGSQEPANQRNWEPCEPGGGLRHGLM
jgi:hypothetical protein